MAAITILDNSLATGGTFPQDVNDAGEIVGYYIDAQGSHGFIYINGTFSAVPQNVVNLEGVNNAGQIVGSTSTDTLHAYDINNAGQVVGSFTDANNASQSFISINGTTRGLSFPGASSTSARGINDLGQVVGYWTGTDSAFPGL